MDTGDREGERGREREREGKRERVFVCVCVFVCVYTTDTPVHAGEIRLGRFDLNGKK